MRIQCQDDAFRIHGEKGTPRQFPLSLQGVYGMGTSLIGEAGEELLEHGLSLEFSDGDEKRHLRLELLLHVIFLNLTYHVYPRLSTKAPNRAEAACEDFEHHLNSLRNLPCFAALNHCHILSGHAAGRPAVIVAPGPSIDFPLLRRLRGKAVIIAVGRVLPRLLAEDLVPDVLYVQETKESGWDEVFRDPNGPALDLVMVCNPVGPIHKYLHRVKRAFKPWNYYLFEKDSMPRLEEIAPSSTTGAYSLAKLMGASPLLFMGCDCGQPIPAEAVLPAYGDLAALTRGGRVPDELLKNLSSYVIERGEGAILVKSDYAACLQWLKSHIFRDAFETGLTAYDSSATGLLSTNGLVGPIPDDFDPPAQANKPLPFYSVPFHPREHVRFLRSRYSYLQRHFKREAMAPAAALVPPINSVFTGIARYDGQPFPLTDQERELVLSRLDLLLEALSRVAV